MAVARDFTHDRWELRRPTPGTGSSPGARSARLSASRKRRHLDRSGVLRGMADRFSRPLGRFAFTVAVAAYAGWAVTATIGDPDTSAQLARSVLSETSVSEQVLGSVTPHLGTLEGLGVPVGSTRAVAEAVMADPRVTDAVATSIRDAHASSLSGDRPARIEVPADVINGVVADAAVAQGLDPTTIAELDGSGIDIPAAHHLGTVVRVAGMWPYAAAGAAGLAVLGAGAARRRSAYVARLAFRVTISAVIVIAAAWAAQRLAAATSNPLGNAIGAVSGVWRSRTTGVLALIAAGGALTWTAARVCTRRRFDRLGSRRGEADVELVAVGDPLAGRAA